MNNNINVTINNKEEAIPCGLTARELIQMRGLKKAAVWVNGSQLLKSEYDSVTFKEDDVIRVLRIMAGG